MCARDSSPNARDTSQNARDTSPNTRDTSQNARDTSQYPLDISQDPRYTLQDPCDTSQDLYDLSPIVPSSLVNKSANSSPSPIPEHHSGNARDNCRRPGNAALNQTYHVNSSLSTSTAQQVDLSPKSSPKTSPRSSPRPRLVSPRSPKRLQDRQVTPYPNIKNVATQLVRDCSPRRSMRLTPPPKPGPAPESTIGVGSKDVGRLEVIESDEELFY